MEGGFGIYLHWPFCQAKCPYCDFNSHVAAAIDEGRWKAAFRSEIGRLAQETGPRRVTSVYFGGGTPSLMSPGLLAGILDTLCATWDVPGEAEITLEANPTSVEAGRLAGFRSAGVNRISMGIQSLVDEDLRRLGRMHTAAEARAAFTLARALFPRASFDLIYARQHQTVPAWRAELSEAIGLAADHLSLYQLTIEEGTAFGARHAAGRLPGLPDEDRAAELWEVTQEMTEAAGLPGYEVSNHARPGAEGRHNLVYWRGGDWIGIGPGAQGRFRTGGRRIATETHLDPARWLSAVEDSGSGELRRSPIPPVAEGEDYVLMALRLREGLSISRARGFGLAQIESRAADLAAQGLLERDGDRLRATARGRLLLDAVLRALLA